LNFFFCRESFLPVSQRVLFFSQENPKNQAPLLFDIEEVFSAFAKPFGQKISLISALMSPLSFIRNCGLSILQAPFTQSEPVVTAQAV
jgi:hypothetical protein